MRADTEAIEALVDTLTHKQHLLTDLGQYFAARRDPVSIGYLITVSVVISCCSLYTTTVDLIFYRGFLARILLHFLAICEFLCVFLLCILLPI